MTDTNIYYLAAPYSHPDPAVRDKRWEKVTFVAADLVLSGKVIISPITMSHVVAMAFADIKLPYDYASNRRLCEALMDSCTAMIVLQTDGTDQSVGVAAEIAYMQAQNKPIWNMTPRDEEVELVFRHSVCVKGVQP